MFILKGTQSLRFIVLLVTCMGALTSCGDKGTNESGKLTKTDPRVQKAFGEKGSWFCTMEIEFSEGTETKSSTRKLLVATAPKESPTTTLLETSCDAETGPGKTICAQKLEAKTYTCVHESLFTQFPLQKGNWECRMDYQFQTEDQETDTDTLVVKGAAGESARKTIATAFEQCAEITDTQSEAKRDACARAMLERKMECKGTATAPAPTASPVPKKVRIFR